MTELSIGNRESQIPRSWGGTREITEKLSVWVNRYPLTTTFTGLTLIAGLVLAASIVLPAGVCGLLGVVLAAAWTQAPALLGWTDSQDAADSRRAQGLILDKQVQNGRRISIYDPGTGLLQRWYFELRLREELSRSHRYGLSMVILVIQAEVQSQTRSDLWGAGKEGRVAQAIAQRLRGVDIAASLGGFEFAMGLPHTDQEGAEAAAARLVRELSDVSLTVGSAMYPRDGEDVDALLVQARRGLVHVLPQAEPVAEPVEVTNEPQPLKKPKAQPNEEEIVRLLLTEEGGEMAVERGLTRRTLKKELRRNAKDLGLKIEIWDEDGKVCFRPAAKKVA